MSAVIERHDEHRVHSTGNLKGKGNHKERKEKDCMIREHKEKHAKDDVFCMMLLHTHRHILYINTHIYIYVYVDRYCIYRYGMMILG